MYIEKKTEVIGIFKRIQGMAKKNYVLNKNDGKVTDTGIYIKYKIQDRNNVSLLEVNGHVCKDNRSIYNFALFSE